MMTNIAKAATVVFAIMAITWIAIHVLGQQPLTTIRVQVSEINYEQSGPILGAEANELRSALMDQLRRRGDIEFVSDKAEYHVRILLNLAQIYCSENEKPSGYSAAVLLVSRITKESVRLDQSIYTNVTIDKTAADAYRGIVRILGLPEKKEDNKPAGVIHTTATLEF